MLTYYRTVREVSNQIAQAIDRSVAALKEGRVEHEPAMTDRMLGAIEQSMDGFEAKGIRWSAKTLTDRGPKSQESKYGADFMGVLNVNLPDFKISKGFLAQAKLDSRSANPTDLKSQCQRMLKLSADSFVFLYGVEGVRVYPATSVVAAEGSVTDLYSRSAQRFFEEHLQCFIGDPEIKTPTPATLTSLQEKYHVRSAILLYAELARL